MKQVNITNNHIDRLIKTFNKVKMTPESVGVEDKVGVSFSNLHNLNTQEDIENYLVEFLVGFGLIKIEEDQQLVYKGFDVTEYYQDAYFRYFEDVE
jgi:hypothetical protein